MDIDVLDTLVRNEAIAILADIGFHADQIKDDPTLIDNVMPALIQSRITREAAILNDARRHVRGSLSPRYANEWAKQASWAETRLSAYHDLGERYPFPDDSAAS